MQVVVRLVEMRVALRRERDVDVIDDDRLAFKFQRTGR